MTTKLEGAQQKISSRSVSVKKSYLIAFLKSLIFIALPCLVASIVNYSFPLEENVVRLLHPISTIPALTAFLGVKGWSIQSWSGKTPEEVLNQKLFKYLTGFGLFLSVFLGLLRPSTPLMEADLKEKIKIELLAELKNMHLDP